MGCNQRSPPRTRSAERMPHAPRCSGMAAGACPLGDGQVWAENRHRNGSRHGPTKDVFCFQGPNRQPLGSNHDFPSFRFVRLVITLAQKKIALTVTGCPETGTGSRM